ncbi:MAG: DUF982 domain-containing protein [Alphaproteobacteria bacterium]
MRQPRFLLMQKYPFKSVTLATKYAGRYRTISSVEEAGEFMLYDWPTEKGPLHLKARTACLDVMLKALDIKFARDAFIAAAKESGIYIREGSP